MAPRIAFLVLPLLLLPVVDAHIALTVTPPTTPIPPFQASQIHVDAAAECADMFVRVPPPTSVSRDLALADYTPKNLTWTGQTVTMPLSGCAPTGSSEASGVITVVPHQGLVAFKPLALTVVCDECEGGDFTLQVGYYGNLTAAVPTGVTVGTTTPLRVQVAANYDTDLGVTVSKPGAHTTFADLAATTAVASPLAEGMLSRNVTIALKPTTSATGWTDDAIELTLVAHAHGQTGNGTALKLLVPVHNVAAPTVSGSSTSTVSPTASGTPTTSPTATSPTTTGKPATSSTSKSTPGWTPLAFLALGILVAALRRRA